MMTMVMMMYVEVLSACLLFSYFLLFSYLYNYQFIPFANWYVGRALVVLVLCAC